MSLIGFARELFPAARFSLCFPSFFSSVLSFFYQVDNGNGTVQRGRLILWSIGPIKDAVCVYRPRRKRKSGLYFRFRSSVSGIATTRSFTNVTTMRIGKKAKSPWRFRYRSSLFSSSSVVNLPMWERGTRDNCNWAPPSSSCDVVVEDVCGRGRKRVHLKNGKREKNERG